MDSQFKLMEKVLNNEGGSIVMINKEKDPPLLVTRLVWPVLNVGNDQMNPGSTLTLFSDGTGRFDCQTLCYKTHSGDTWQHWITLYDQNNNTLFGVGYFYSPRMDDGNPPPVYTWSAAFTFDASKFASVAKGQAFYSA